MLMDSAATGSHLRTGLCLIIKFSSRTTWKTDGICSTLAASIWVHQTMEAHNKTSKLSGTQGRELISSDRPSVHPVPMAGPNTICQDPVHLHIRAQHRMTQSPTWMVLSSTVSMRLIKYALLVTQTAAQTTFNSLL